MSCREKTLTNAYDSYLDSVILSADPMELVSIMYGAARDAVGRARTALERGDIGTRSREITKTSEIINELLLSLDHSRGGEISRNLAELYDYMQRRLNEANAKQSMEPLVEVAALLATLKDGWDKGSASLRPAVAEPVPAFAGQFGRECTPEYSGLSFSC
jgi:flagellar secretion chaperone FliS